MPSETMQRTSEIPEKGLPKSKIHEMLDAKLQRDFSYSFGKILSSMCTSPHGFAKQIYRMTLKRT